MFKHGYAGLLSDIDDDIVANLSEADRVKLTELERKERLLIEERKKGLIWTYDHKSLFLWPLGGAVMGFVFIFFLAYCGAPRTVLFLGIPTYYFCFAVAWFYFNCRRIQKKLKAFSEESFSLSMDKMSVCGKYIDSEKDFSRSIVQGPPVF